LLNYKLKTEETCFYDDFDNRIGHLNASVRAIFAALTHR
jgi:hypothetical protein